VRKYLSSELGFTREHRELNITRIGFVASEITKNRGIAICAPIAPYEESRQANRELIAKYGGFVEVFMATPLSICEQRDRKGLYAKARKGLMKGVTGIDDPYIPPLSPDITIDTTEMTPTEAAQVVMLYLEEQGYIR
jgi:sulfate adenylyltransferase